MEFKVPSPAEVEAAKTKRGAWTRKQLAAWGVPWPPPKGWRDELRRLHAGKTRSRIVKPVSVRFMCPVCRVAVPERGVCEECADPRLIEEVRDLAGRVRGCIATPLESLSAQELRSMRDGFQARWDDRRPGLF